MMLTPPSTTASASCPTPPPTTPSAPPPPPPPPMTQGKQLRSNDPLSDIHLIIGAKLRVTMTDGRVAHGTFVALDRLCNIILDNVIEYREIAYIDPTPSNPSGSGGGLSGREDGNEVGNHSTINLADSQEGNNNNHPQIYRWNTERSLSQAVIRGDRLAKVEIVKDEWAKRTGRCIV